MTPAEAKTMCEWYDSNRPAIEAFANGKRIEQFAGGQWVDVYQPFFSRDSEYRVKPEPKLRPYTDAELKEQVGKVFVLKTGMLRVVSVECGVDWIRLYSQPAIHAKELLKEYTHLDGSPCGVTE